jgi:hypothetical protein
MRMSYVRSGAGRSEQPFSNELAGFEVSGGGLVGVGLIGSRRGPGDPVGEQLALFAVQSP